MWPNLQLAADLVTFTEEILNGKLHFLWRVWCISAAPLITPNRQNFGFKAVNYISRVFEWLGKTFVALGNITLIVIYSPIVLYFQFVLVALIKFAIIGNSSHCISQRVWKSSHRRCSVLFFQNSRENTCAGACFSIKLRAWCFEPSALLKNRLQPMCFPLNFEKFSRILFLQSTSGRLLLKHVWLSCLHFVFCICSLLLSISLG